MSFENNFVTFMKARLECSIAGDHPYHYNQIRKSRNQYLNQVPQNLSEICVPVPKLQFFTFKELNTVGGSCNFYRRTKDVESSSSEHQAMFFISKVQNFA